MDAIARAFSSAPQLQTRIRQAQTKSPNLQQLFDDVATFIEQTSAAASENAPKKRKFDVVSNGTNKHRDNESWGTGIIDTINDISFSVPVRKKLRLEIGSQNLQGVRGTNPQNGDHDVEARWRNIEHIVCLPVPEKAQPQYNFCIFPKNGSGLGTSVAEETIQDQIVWTVPAITPKPGVCSDTLQAGEDDSYKDIILRVLNSRLSRFRKDIGRVIEPNEQDFASELAQAHRKGEKGYHVKAFRGSKDGFLFFLSTGIVWGFKKPLAFFAFDTINSISYTSVLQRTFNLNIGTRTPGDETQEIEFSMIDQVDFAGIDAYIKRHELQDASMAEQRRAKKYNVNKVKGEEVGEDDETGPSELEKAQKEVVEAEGAQRDDDDDEEDDENFDPGSEGESEGSGTSSEEADGDEQMADDDDDNREDG